MSLFDSIACFSRFFVSKSLASMTPLTKQGEEDEETDDSEDVIHRTFTMKVQDYETETFH